MLAVPHKLLSERLRRATGVRLVPLAGAFTSLPNQAACRSGFGLTAVLRHWCAGRQRTDGPARCLQSDFVFVRPCCTDGAPTANGRAARSADGDCAFGLHYSNIAIRNINRVAPSDSDAISNASNTPSSDFRRLTLLLTGLPKAGPVE